MVRSALIQAHVVSNRKENLDNHLQMILQAARRGARIVCLGELFNSISFLRVKDEKWFAAAEPIPGPTVSAVAAAAKELGVAVIAPIYEVTDAGDYYNSAAVIDADGALLGVYRKNHLLTSAGCEWFYYGRGNLGYPVFQTAFARIGVLICYDRQFPESARALALKGAEIIFIPAASSRGLVDHIWVLGQRMIAAANQCFVGSVNRVGTEELNSAGFYGNSHFCDPRGAIIAQAGETEQGVLIADLDLRLVSEARAQLSFLKDRRPETYGDLVNLP